MKKNILRLDLRTDDSKKIKFHFKNNEEYLGFEILFINYLAHIVLKRQVCRQHHSDIQIRKQKICGKMKENNRQHIRFV